MTVSFFKYGLPPQKADTTVQTKPQINNEPQIIRKRETQREVADLPSGYTITKNNSKTRLSAEELFDIQYQSGTELSNGAKLLKPVSFSLGKVDITQSDTKGIYTVTITPTYYRQDSEPISRTMTEKELVDNKALFRGFIKPSSTQAGKYAITFFDKNREIQKLTATKEDCLKIMEENLLYI